MATLPWYHSPNPGVVYRDSPEGVAERERDAAEAERLGLSVTLGTPNGWPGERDLTLRFTGPDEAREAFGRVLDQRWGTSTEWDHSGE